jgi:hypothetical protein
VAGEPVVSTFVPPSMTHSAAGSSVMNESIIDSLADASAHKDKLPPAVRKVWTQENTLRPEKSQEMEETLALHQSMSMTAGDDDEEVKPKTRVAFTSTKSSINNNSNGNVPSSALRKVRSMDPRMMTSVSQPKNVMFDPVEVVRSWSKTIMNNDNEVELEVVTEESDSRTESSSKN